MTAAAQMTANPTALSVLSVLSALDPVSLQHQVKRKFPQTRKPARSLTRVEREKRLRLLSFHEKSTTVPFEAWAVPKLFSRVCHSLTSPAHQPFHPAVSQLWFLKKSIWLMTGWRMIWGKFSQRRRGGFEWSRMV